MGNDTNVDRPNVTSEQMAPRRVSADGLKYLRLGYGAVTGPSTTTGVAMGFGYRYELDRLAVQISIADLIIATDNASQSRGGGVNGDIARLSGFLYPKPIANQSIYYRVAL